MTAHRPATRWTDIPPARRAEAAAAMCDGKEPMEPRIAREVAKRMRGRRRIAVEAYRCLRCGRWHVGKPMGAK